MTASRLKDRCIYVFCITFRVNHVNVCYSYEIWKYGSSYRTCVIAVLRWNACVSLGSYHLSHTASIAEFVFVLVILLSLAIMSDLGQTPKETREVAHLRFEASALMAEVSIY